MRRSSPPNPLISLAIAALLVGSTTAQAAPPPDVYRDDRGSIYVHGDTASAAGDRLSVAYIGTPSERRLRAGFCGEIRLPALPISESFTIAETGQTFSTFPASGQKCRDAQLVGGSERSWSDSQGNRYIGGFTPGARYTVRFNQSDRVRTVSKRCGFFRIANSRRYPIPAQVGIGGVVYSTATLPVAVAQRCQQIGGEDVRFTPVSW